jgi:Tfp pilus assembly protein FimT
VSHRTSVTNERGFSVGEILAVLAIIAVVTTVTAPTMLTYWRAAALKGAAQELATIANQARALSISRHTLVCMNQSGNRIRLMTGGCAGTAWVGSGTDANGWFRLDNAIAITNNPQVVFNPLGSASTAGSFTVHNTSNGANMSVTVAGTGRVTVGP